MIVPILALLTFGTHLLGPVTVSVNATEGETITGTRRFKITVQADNPVTQVEFYVGDELRNSDTSTPYEFDINALDETEGPMKLNFIAYTTEGETGKKAFGIKIDNGMSKGPDFHVKRGLDFLTDGKFDEAIQSGKIALKAKAAYVPARVLLARAYFAKGTLDQAQKFLEDVLTEDPKNNDALELMAGINLQTAFRSIAAEGGDKYEVLERIRTALVSAAEKRRKVLDSRFDAVGAVTESNLMAYCDEAIRSSRYWAAISALQQRFLRDPSNSAVSNRLAYSQLRSSKIQDAYTTLTTVKRKAALDAYGYGLLAVIEAAIGNNAASDDAIREAILSDSEDMGMRTAQVFVALNRGKLGAMGDLVSGLQRDAGQRPEVNYYLATLLYMQQNYSDAEKRFQKAVLADPCLYDMYIQRANEALRSVVSENLSGEAAKYRFAVAKAYFDAALAAKADSPEALTGVALANVLQSKPGECLKYARAAVAANPSYAAGQYTLAMVGSAVSNDLQTKAEQIRNEDKDGILDAEQKKQMADLQKGAKDLKSELRKAYEAAQKLDKVLNGSQIPNTFDAFQYYYRFGRLPLLTMPK